MAKDLYQVLGVGREASAKELKRAYRRLAHRYHPDKNPGDAHAEERFKEVTQAYEVLGDPEKRKKYDRFGHQAFPGGSGAGPTHFGDVFSEIFSDFFGKRPSRGRARGSDRTVTVAVDFVTAAKGGERTIEVPRTKRCETCSGTGAKPGTTPQICHACGGSGEIRVQQGLLSVSKRCGYCKGRGRVLTHPCRDCDGEGRLQRSAHLKVRIPAGADPETVLRYAGEGEPGVQGGAPGDLLVTLEITPHPVFRRQGADLLCELPITLTQAALGAQVDVPTLDGKVRMTIPAGTQSGRVFRLRGKGVARGGGGQGDQHVTVTIETPTALSAADRELLARLEHLDTDEHYPDRRAFWDRASRPR